MNKYILIGIGAGVASALLYLSVATGNFIAILLFYIAPLPLLIAGLGWGIFAALIGAVVGLVAAAFAAGPMFALIYLFGCAAPSAWLVRNALLSRPVDEADPQGPREWYPAGMLVLWSAAFGALVTTIGIMTLGGSAAAFERTIDEALRAIITENNDSLPAPETFHPERFIGFVTTALPLIAAAMWTFFMAGNLWLAGRIVSASGQMLRPMPDLTEMRLPRGATLVFAAAGIATLGGGTIGLLAKPLAGALFAAFMLLGLVVIHAITRGMAARGLILGGVYLFTFLFGWAIVPIAMIGLADPMFDFRARRSGGRQWPPT